MTSRLSNRIIAISMAFLLLIANTGFSIDSHYCQGELKGFSLFGRAECCSEMQAEKTCHDIKKKSHCLTDKEDLVLTDNCCHNENVSLLGFDSGINKTELSSAQNVDFAITFINLHIIKVYLKDNFHSFELFDPHLTDKNFQVLFQNFLI